MEKYEELKKISGDSVVVSEITTRQPTIHKSIGGATYIARMYFRGDNNKTLETKLLRLMESEMGKREG